MCHRNGFNSAWDLGFCTGYPEWICEIAWNEIMD